MYTAPGKFSHNALARVCLFSKWSLPWFCLAISVILWTCVLLTRFYMLVRKNNLVAKQAVQCSQVLPCDPLVQLRDKKFSYLTQLEGRSMFHNRVQWCDPFRLATRGTVLVSAHMSRLPSISIGPPRANISHFSMDHETVQNNNIYICQVLHSC